MRRPALLSTFVWLGLSLSICACAPQVRYQSFPLDFHGSGQYIGADASPGAIDFLMRGSTIAIAADAESLQIRAKLADGPKLPGPRAAELQQLQALVAPLELPGTLYRATPNDQPLYHPNVSITYVQNSLLVDSLGTAAVNEVPKLLTAIGSAVITAGLLRRSCSEEELHLPIVIDADTLKLGEWRHLPNGPRLAPYECWWYRFDAAGPIFPGEDITAFFDARRNWTRHFPYAVCQDVRLTITHHDGPPPPLSKDGAASWRIRIADPARVRSYVLPSSGQVKLHPICGADLAQTPSDSASALDVFIELMNQIKQIKEARQADDGT